MMSLHLKKRRKTDLLYSLLDEAWEEWEDVQKRHRELLLSKTKEARRRLEPYAFEWMLEQGLIPDPKLDKVVRPCDKEIVAKAILRHVRKTIKEKNMAKWKLAKIPETSLEMGRKMVLKKAKQRRKKYIRLHRRLKRQVVEAVSSEQTEELFKRLVQVEKELLLMQPVQLDELTEEDKKGE